MNHVESIANDYKNACIRFNEPELLKSLFEQHYPIGVALEFK